MEFLPCLHATLEPLYNLSQALSHDSCQSIVQLGYVGTAKVWKALFLVWQSV